MLFGVKESVNYLEPSDSSFAKLPVCFSTTEAPDKFLRVDTEISSFSCACELIFTYRDRTYTLSFIVSEIPTSIIHDTVLGAWES